MKYAVLFDSSADRDTVAALLNEAELKAFTVETISDSVLQDYATMHDEMLAAINAAKVPDENPTAWLTDRGTMHFDKEDAWRDCDGFIQALYAELPKRKPLTNEQINSMISAREPEDTHEWYLGFWHQGFEQGVRSAEAAHGIGEVK